VSGLNPEKEKHQFFIDVVPEFGFPLAIRYFTQKPLNCGKFHTLSTFLSNRKTIDIGKSRLGLTLGTDTGNDTVTYAGV
jgi:hypothetical protein